MPSNAVAKRDEPKVLDLESAQASRKFLEAYSGKIAQMNAEQQAMFLMALGQLLGVKAELGEIILYQGKPYITLDGRLRLAHASGLFSGLEARPATQLERRNYGAEDGEALWVADAYRRGAGRSFKGWGHVPKTDRNPVSKTHPREMAKKRAKYDALRIAFPPAEQITEMHAKFIEEAEDQIQRGAFQPHAVAMLTGYDEGADAETTDAEVTGNEQAADAGETLDEGMAKAHVRGAFDKPAPTGELPLGDAKKTTPKTGIPD